MHGFTKESLDLVQTYGLGVFLSLAVLFLCYKLIRYILSSNDKREERLGQIITQDLAKNTAAMQAQTVAIQGITSTLDNIQKAQASAQQLAQTRYDNLLEANRHQRNEHALLIQKLEQLHLDLRDGSGCKSGGA